MAKIKIDYSAQIAECQWKLGYYDSEISATRTMLIKYDNFKNEINSISKNNEILIQDLEDTISIVYDSYENDGKKIDEGLLDNCLNKLKFIVSLDIKEIMQEIARKINELNNKLNSLYTQRASVQADLDWYLSQ